MIDDPRTRQVIGLAMNIHRAFGPGLLESAYKEFMCIELEDAGILASPLVLYAVK